MEQTKAHTPINVETIRYWMARRGLNQRGLALAVGVTESAISYLFSRPDGGARLTFATGVAIAEVLDVAPRDLLAPPPADNTAPTAGINTVGAGSTEA